MKKILLILSREYLTRVRNKTFIILTILGPVLYVLMILSPVLLMKMSEQTAAVLVVDNSGKLQEQLKSTEEIRFIYLGEESKGLSDRELLKIYNADYLLKIPEFEDNNLRQVELLSEKKAGVSIPSKIENMISEELKTRRLRDLGLNQSAITEVDRSVNVRTIVSTDEGETETSSGIAAAVAMVGGFLIYFFIFLYGGLVLRGVQEEKQSRIVEVIISSVKPFQLMLGKILGIALVGLSQFALWVILTAIISTVAGAFIATPEMAESGRQMAEQQGGMGNMVQELQGQIGSLNMPLLIGGFIFYFLFGYLMYSALFASFAAAADSQSDTYQFMFPASVPLIFGIMSITAIVGNPDGSLAFWLSMIPFTAPVAMIARLPFDVPAWEILLSMLLMVFGFIGTTWLAGKIYRTGILMYGKKITYKELGKWLFYKG